MTYCEAINRLDRLYEHTIIDYELTTLTEAAGKNFDINAFVSKLISTIKMIFQKILLAIKGFLKKSDKIILTKDIEFKYGLTYDFKYTQKVSKHIQDKLTWFKGTANDNPADPAEFTDDGGTPIVMKAGQTIDIAKIEIVVSKYIENITKIEKAIKDSAKYVTYKSVDGKQTYLLSKQSQNLVKEYTEILNGYKARQADLSKILPQLKEENVNPEPAQIAAKSTVTESISEIESLYENSLDYKTTFNKFVAEKDATLPSSSDIFKFVTLIKKLNKEPEGDLTAELKVANEPLTGEKLKKDDVISNSAVNKYLRRFKPIRDNMDELTIRQPHKKKSGFEASWRFKADDMYEKSSKYVANRKKVESTLWLYIDVFHALVNKDYEEKNNMKKQTTITEAISDLNVITEAFFKKKPIDPNGTSVVTRAGYLLNDDAAKLISAAVEKQIAIIKNPNKAPVSLSEPLFEQLKKKAKAVSVGDKILNKEIMASSKVAGDAINNWFKKERINEMSDAYQERFKNDTTKEYKGGKECSDAINAWNKFFKDSMLVFSVASKAEKVKN